ncbi:MAG TPA: hypothetical protein VIM73_22765 [Polyangiaceae bacterium]
MLAEIAEELDRWIAQQNFEARRAGLPQFRSCTIVILGQMALLEGAVALTLASTKDVDVKADYSHPVQKEFERLLNMRGRTLDPLGREVWMPEETMYTPLFEGPFVRVLVADADAVLLSKALKAPDKNRALLTEYLARGPSQRFLALAKRYALDLEQFL